MSIIENSRSLACNWPKTGIHEGLPFLGGMILGVFAEIAVRACLQDLLRQLVPQFVLQRRNFSCSFFFNSSIL